MKRLQPLVFSAALLLLAACGQNTQPEAAAPSFSFSIDPGSETVNLTSADAAALSALQLGACGEDEPRVLFAEEELALETFDFVFLPGNILEITASFTNVTGFDFEQPFTFTQAESTNNIVSSQEPEVTDADLGGDGVLSPDETTSVLTFTVEHMGQPFTYEVLAEAVVRCGNDGEEPGEPGEPGEPEFANLGVVKTGPGEVTLGTDGTATLDFNVVVTNEGAVAAEGVVLTDTLVIDLAGLVDVEADITAIDLPVGCSLDVSLSGTGIITCDLSTLDAGEVADLNFSFDLGLVGDLTGVTSIDVTNTAEAITDTLESDDTNNIVEVVTDVLVPVAPAVANITVAKTGDTSAPLDENGDATLDFTVVVTNEGDAIAEGVELTDTFVIDLGAFTGDVTLAATLLPDGCILSADGTVDDTVIAICTLGALAAGESSTLDFTFTVDLPADVLPTDGPFTVANTAFVETTSEETDLADNTVTATATVAAPDLGTAAAGM